MVELELALVELGHVRGEERSDLDHNDEEKRDELRHCFRTSEFSEDVEQRHYQRNVFTSDDELVAVLEIAQHLFDQSHDPVITPHVWEVSSHYALDVLEQLHFFRGA